MCHQQGRDGLAGEGQGVDRRGGKLDVLVRYLAEFNAVTYVIKYLDGLQRVRSSQTRPRP